MMFKTPPLGACPRSIPGIRWRTFALRFTRLWAYMPPDYAMVNCRKGAVVFVLPWSLN